MLGRGRHSFGQDLSAALAPTTNTQVAGSAPISITGTGTVANWTPLTLGSKVKLWLPADQGVDTSSTHVWTSSEGSSFQYDQATAGQRPAVSSLNGHACLDFDGSNDDLVGPTWQTIFGALSDVEMDIIFRADTVGGTTATSGAGLFNRSGGVLDFSVGSNGAWVGVFNNSSALVTKGTTNSTSTATTYRARFTIQGGTAITVQLGSTAAATQALGTLLTGLYNSASIIGLASDLSKFYDGKICEIVGTNALCTTGERAVKDSYYVDRWGAQV